MVHPIITTSCTVTGKLQSMVSSWGTYPARGLLWVTDWPSTMTSPPYRSTVPRMQRSSVLLPEPLGPRKPTKSPGSMLMLTSVSTCLPS